MNNSIKAVSLFSSIGIGELLLDNIFVNVIIANELVKERAKCHQFLYPNSNMIQGDICDDNIKNQIIQEIVKQEVSLLIATPPCQGFSTIGKNKIQEDFIKDRRNFLILEVLDIMDRTNLDYVLIENVPKFISMLFPYKKQLLTIKQILIDKYQDNYNIEVITLNAKDYGTPQSRPRSIIKLYKKNLVWHNPPTENEVHLYEAIKHLPSLEAGQYSDIKWHYSKPLPERHILTLKYTPTGCSAMQNPYYYPKKENGERIKGFHNTYKRMHWNTPAPARTTYSGSISSHNNVHPGRLQSDNTYSDARVLTLLELFIVSSIPVDIEFPKSTSDTFIRTMVGESVPPLLMNKILQGIQLQEVKI